MATWKIGIIGDGSLRLAPLLLAGALFGAGCSKPAAPAPGPDASARAVAPAKLAPDDVPRRSPDEIHGRVLAGQSLLVCAYEDDGKYQGLKLEGSISLHELERRASSLGREQELVFYCA